MLVITALGTFVYTYFRTSTDGRSLCPACGRTGLAGSEMAADGSPADWSYVATWCLTCQSRRYSVATGAARRPEETAAGAGPHASDSQATD